MNIWTNGCFDILHTGHIELLTYAKFYNPELLLFSSPVICHNTLYVGLDSDERVKQLKGDKRPINDINTRITMMRNLRMVDKVFIFNTDDELRNLVKELNIDYMIVGDQYKNREVIGHENSRYGVVYYEVDSRSSTNVIEKIKKEAKLEVFEKIWEKFKDESDSVSINMNNFAVSNIKKLML
jgi:D-beta-D-heptose 7-phosphate kinase/D-beta-D-heptose 1-phosphate adenosyltransferase